MTKPGRVAKVEELMTLCDQLEDAISQNAAKKQHLRQAMLHHALNNGHNVVVQESGK